MAKSFSLEQLTEGIRSRHLGTQNRRLVEKWSRTGLLRGLDGVNRENMSRLLENQAGQLLREANSISTGGGSMTSSGDLRGFTNIAFPIVRRVFGGLVANELVSIQPMSLPSGLLFYLDYTYGSDNTMVAAANQTTPFGGDDAGRSYTSGSSIYGQPVGKGVQSGALGVGGMYDLAGSGYSRVYDNISASVAFVGTFGGANAPNPTTASDGLCAATSGSDAKLMQFDPQILDQIDDEFGAYTFCVLNISDDAYPGATPFANTDLTLIKEFALHSNGNNTTGDIQPVQHTGNRSVQGGRGILNVRRLNQLGTFNYSTQRFTHDPLVKSSTGGDSGNNDNANVDVAAILMVVSGCVDVAADALLLDVLAPMGAALNQQGDGDTLTIPSFESDFGTTPSPEIPEIDIKIESLAVTAVTRKLRARWSPELAQDLNAYHSLDAEVELTQILSEQIALEIDREVLNDLLTEAKTNYYWSRSPGNFVNKSSGAVVTRNSTLHPGPSFTGTVREWYETLVETVIDVANEIHRLTLRGSANFIVVSPDIATILEASVLYRPAYTLDGEGQVSTPFSLGAEKIGTLSNRFTVYKDPYFPRNKVLVGYKGGSYLETGYVYAPYVPLIVTPTIFAPEDFTPRKGVMTRYGKKMVRSDFYGTVTVLDLNVI